MSAEKTLTLAMAMDCVSTNRVDLLVTAIMLTMVHCGREIAVNGVGITIQLLNEPRCEKTCLWGFRPDRTQNGLYNHRRWLEA